MSLAQDLETSEDVLEDVIFPTGDLYQFRLHRNDIALVFGHQWKQVIPLTKEDCFSRTWQR
ncbi:MAG: hypothetical protein HC941_00340 [Microcoleus sp. SU_5_3]|nr:hypothetical protein [Microcoleus sp. SU_5_3]